MPFISSSCLTAVARTSSTMLNKNGASGSPMGGGEHQSGSWVSGGMDPAPKPNNSVRDIPKSSQASTAWLRQLTPQQSKSSAGLCYRESRVWSYCIPLADAARKGVLHPRKMASWCGRVTQHRYPGSCPFSSLPRPQSPASLQRTLL